jgi:hypothetical protein
MENTITEKLTNWEKYYNSFIQEMKDYNDLSKTEFYLAHVDYVEHRLWKVLEDGFKEQDEILLEEEYREQYVANEVGDEYRLDELIQEYFYPLDKKDFFNKRDDEHIYEILLTIWWPNIFLNINTRWDSYEYEFNWGWEKLVERIYDEDVINSINEIYIINN